MTPDVRLHVEELVLDGFAPGDRHEIGEALERELTRLLEERGLPPTVTGSEWPRLDGGSFELAPGLRAEAIGARVATAVYEGLGR